MSEVFDNPFAIRPQGRRRPLIASLRGLLIIAALLVAVIVLQSQTRQWLLNRWVSGIAELPVDEQIERLLQIDSLGDLATETLARRIAAVDEPVAAKAFELLRQRQTAWSTREDDSLARAHGSMLAGLSAIVDDLPPTRSHWVTQLLNQTIVECVDQRGTAMKQTYAQATGLAMRFAASGGASPAESFVDTDRTNLPPPSLVPLPVRMQSLDDDPQPPRSTAQSAEPLPVIVARDEPPVIVARPGGESVRARSAIPDPFPNPLSLPSTGRGEGAAEALPERSLEIGIAGPAQAVRRVSTQDDLARSAADGQPIKMLSSNSLQALDTKSVIGLLASKQTAIADAAVDELVRRGLSKEEIRVAHQLAAPQVEVRLGLLDSIVRRTDIDPRPWLLWLAEDSNREVRLRAVSALVDTNDAAVTRTLRKRLAAEADPSVIAQIHKAIERR